MRFDLQFIAIEDRYDRETYKVRKMTEKNTLLKQYIPKRYEKIPMF